MEFTPSGKRPLKRSELHWTPISRVWGLKNCPLSGSVRYRGVSVKGGSTAIIHILALNNLYETIVNLGEFYFNQYKIDKFESHAWAAGRNIYAFHKISIPKVAIYFFITEIEKKESNETLS